jgi:hypothetical protein
MTFDTTPIPVPIGDCRCPESPHGEGDVVFLAPFLSMAGGMAAQGAIEEAGTDAVALAELLARIWIRHGIVSWNLVDADGEPIPVSASSILEFLPYGKGGRQVAEKADDIYAQDVLTPFEERVAAARLQASGAGSTRKPKASSSTRRSTRKPR